jgi:hypothetical protein
MDFALSQRQQITDLLARVPRPLILLYVLFVCVATPHFKNAFVHASLSPNMMMCQCFRFLSYLRTSLVLLSCVASRQMTVSEAYAIDSVRAHMDCLVVLNHVNIIPTLNCQPTSLHNFHLVCICVCVCATGDSINSYYVMARYCQRAIGEQRIKVGRLCFSVKCLTPHRLMHHLSFLFLSVYFLETSYGRDLLGGGMGSLDARTQTSRIFMFGK